MSVCHTSKHEYIYEVGVWGAALIYSGRQCPHHLRHRWPLLRSRLHCRHFLLACFHWSFPHDMNFTGVSCGRALTERAIADTMETLDTWAAWYASLSIQLAGTWSIATSKQSYLALLHRELCLMPHPFFSKHEMVLISPLQVPWTLAMPSKLQVHPPWSPTAYAVIPAQHEKSKLLSSRCSAQAVLTTLQLMQANVKSNLITATSAGSGLGCLLMGLGANLPLATAPGMGLNAYFAYNVVGYRGSGNVSSPSFIQAIHS